MGGLPQYLLSLDDTRSIDVNIRRHLLDEFAPLFHESTFLLREELREIAPYHAILFAVASGHGNVPAIAAATELPARNLHYYLQQLVNLGYLRRRYPLERRRRNPKQMRFGIDDPLLRFWFRFVFPNMSAIRSAGVGRAFSERVAPSLDAWFGTCFERLCREALPRIYASEGVGTGFEIGEYWSPDAQIDVVGMRDDNWTDLGECKWRTVRSPRALEAELGSVPQHPGRDAWPPLLRAPQARGQGGGEGLVLAPGPVCPGWSRLTFRGGLNTPGAHRSSIVEWARRESWPELRRGEFGPAGVVLPQGRGAIALSAPHGACPHAVRGAGAVVEQALVVLGLLAAKLDHRVVHVDDSAAHLLAQVIDRAKQTRTEIVVFGINDRIRGPLFAFDVLDRIPDDRIVATEKEARDLAWSLLQRRGRTDRTTRRISRGHMARPERFELPTTWFVARYSIQLSYGRVKRRDYRGSPARGRARMPWAPCPAPETGTRPDTGIGVRLRTYEFLPKSSRDSLTEHGGRHRGVR